MPQTLEALKAKVSERRVAVTSLVAEQKAKREAIKAEHAAKKAEIAKKAETEQKAT
jgi:hypothetical protein